MNERIKITIFLPEAATVGQLIDVLYWTKNYDDFIEDTLNDVRGCSIEVLVKPEYLDRLREELQKAGGQEK